MIFSFGLAVGLFVVLPHALSLWAGRSFGFDESRMSFHILDGLLKFSIFLAYVWGIGLIPDIKRVYAYHGAEHKAIHVYEASLPLIPASAKPFPAWHPRCGTAFIFLMLALSILFFALVFPLFFRPEGMGMVQRTALGVGLKTLLLIPLAGLSYEITRLAGKPDSGLFWKILLWPGLLLQRLTTSPPDDGQLEVAMDALSKAVLTEDSNLPQGS
jgi:uncharacterized protein YqhQ